MPLVCPPCVLFVVKSSRSLGPNTRNGVMQSWSVTVVRRRDFGRSSGASLSAGNSSPSTPDMLVRHPITPTGRASLAWKQFCCELAASAVCEGDHRGVVDADTDVEDSACELALRALQLLEVFIGSTIQLGIIIDRWQLRCWFTTDCSISLTYWRTFRISDKNSL